MGKHKLKVEARGDREIVMTRLFDAPRALVFDAHTKPELMKRWFGVMPGWELAVCEVDLRVGGKYRYLWRGPAGAQMGMRGVYKEIVRPERLVNTEKFDESWYPGEAVESMTLTETNGRTTLTSVIRYDSAEARAVVLESPMEQGVAAGHDNLDAVLASLTTAKAS